MEDEIKNKGKKLGKKIVGFIMGSTIGTVIIIIAVVAACLLFLLTAIANSGSANASNVRRRFRRSYGDAVQICADYIAYWELPTLMAFLNGTGSYDGWYVSNAITPDAQYYRVYVDSAGLGMNLQYGINIESNNHHDNLLAWVGLDDTQLQHNVGMEVEREVIDRYYMMFIEHLMSNVRTNLEGIPLSDEQVIAIAARLYNTGESETRYNNFRNAYNSGDEEQIRQWFRGTWNPERGEQHYRLFRYGEYIIDTDGTVMDTTIYENPDDPGGSSGTDDPGSSGGTTVGNGNLRVVDPSHGYWGYFERGGKTYTLFYQNFDPSTGGRQGGGALNWGVARGLCLVTSLSILESGKGHIITPKEIYQRYGWSGRSGLGYPEERSASEFNSALNALRNNKPIIIDWNGGSHYFPVLDIKNNYVLVINSFWDGATSIPTNSGRTSGSGFSSGWYTTDEIRRITAGFYIGG